MKQLSTRWLLLDVALKAVPFSEGVCKRVTVPTAFSQRPALSETGSHAVLVRDSIVDGSTHGLSRLCLVRDGLGIDHLARCRLLPTVVMFPLFPSSTTARQRTHFPITAVSLPIPFSQPSNSRPKTPECPLICSQATGRCRPRRPTLSSSTFSPCQKRSGSKSMTWSCGVPMAYTS